MWPQPRSFLFRCCAPALIALALGGCIPRVVSDGAGQPLEFATNLPDSSVVLFIKVFYGEWGILSITPPDPKVRGRRLMQVHQLPDDHMVFPKEKGFSIFTPLFLTWDAYHDYEFVLLAPGMTPSKGKHALPYDYGRPYSGKYMVSFETAPYITAEGALNTLEGVCCRYVTGGCEKHRKPSLTTTAQRRFAAYLVAELGRIENSDATLHPRAEALRLQITRALD